MTPSAGVPSPDQTFLRAQALRLAFDDVQVFLRRFVVLTEAQLVAITLWVAHTYVFDRFYASPYLAIVSPEKRAGKTRLLEMLEWLVARPWRVILPSEAVLFRKIHQDHPTLLLDEADTIFRDKRQEGQEGLRGVLNASNRKGSRVPRVLMQGQTATFQEFDVYCPKAIAGIGCLPETIMDRAIVIRMQRRRPDQPVEKYREEWAQAEAAPLRARLAMALASLESIPDAPSPPGLSDRLEDSWRPLLGLAQANGSDRLALAQQSALALRLDESNDASRAHQLLLNVRELLSESDRARTLVQVHGVHGAFVPTKALVAALREEDHWGWGEADGKPLTARRLARMLQTYDLEPEQQWSGAERVRGYPLNLLEQAFATWLEAPLSLPPGRL